MNLIKKTWKLASGMLLEAIAVVSTVLSLQLMAPTGIAARASDFIAQGLSSFASF